MEHRTTICQRRYWPIIIVWAALGAATANAIGGWVQHIDFGVLCAVSGVFYLLGCYTFKELPDVR